MSGDLRNASFPTASGPSGVRRKYAPSVKNETNEATSGGVPDQALSALRIAARAASRSTSSTLGEHPTINRLRTAAKRDDVFMTSDCAASLKES